MNETVSHYRILEQIGAGGMGIVFRAHDERLDRDVALKVPVAGTIVDGSARRRFHKEALALSKLNHPNIATVYEFGAEDGAEFLVEEFIEGRSLDTVLLRGPLLENEVIRLGVQMADGLSAAHEHGIIHRDLKPSNVRITSDGRLKILDFGLALILRREVSPTAVTESLSQTKLQAGTLPYMAPEQLLGDSLDARTDVWGAGCVLYEMATGKRPFTGSSGALTEAVLHGTPEPIRKLNPNISAALEAVVEKCLDKQPDRRYQSAREIAVDLQRSASAPVSTGLRLRLKRSVLGTVLSVIIALGIGIGIEKVLVRSVFRSRPGAQQELTQPAPSRGRRPPVAASETQPNQPFELYLSGVKQLERWDKADSLSSAIASFEQAVKADPNFALGFSALAEAYWAKFRLDHDSRWMEAAETNCRRASAVNTRLPAIYVTLARVHNGQGQYNLALQEVQEALQLAPLDPDALLAEASIYGSMGRHGDAETTYVKAAALRPQYWGGYYELGVYYFRLQRYADAATEFERVLSITPDNAIAHATLGGTLQLLGKNADAEKHLRASIELQPTYAAYNNLGVLYYTQRRWAESIAMTRKALEINASDWSAWLNLGLAYEWLGRKRDAADAFHNELARLEEIAKIKPDDADVQIALGVLYSRQKLREKAVADIEAALAQSPRDPAVLVSAGEAYENLGDRTRALELVAKAMANGWTLKQLQNDPGQQDLIRDPRFRQRANQVINKAGPAQ